MDSKYLILLTILIAATAILGIVSMQLIPAVIGIAIILAAHFFAHSLRNNTPRPIFSSGNEAIIAAALIALVGIISEMIVWAATLGVLLVVQLSVARIERRLDGLENQRVPQSDNPGTVSQAR